MPRQGHHSAERKRWQADCCDGVWCVRGTTRLMVAHGSLHGDGAALVWRLKAPHNDCSASLEGQRGTAGRPDVSDQPRMLNPMLRAAQRKKL